MTTPASYSHLGFRMHLPSGTVRPRYNAMPARDYAELVARVRVLIASSVPPASTVAVVSKGDGELLRLEHCVGWHFPRLASGAYAGHHPADDADAIRRLEATHADGANFLVFPATALWWLDYYEGFRRYLESRFHRIVDEPGTAVIYSLSSSVVTGQAPQPELKMRAATLANSSYDAYIGQVRGVASALLPAGARVIVATGGDDSLLDLGGPGGWHFPQHDDGHYVGSDPADSCSIVAHLETMRTAGAEYLLIPRPAHWWLDSFAGFRAYIQQAYLLVTRQENVCTIYDLRDPTPYDELVQSVHTAIAGAIPFGSNLLVASSGDSRLVDIADQSAWHFPQTTERKYAGNPINDVAAIALVENLRAQGAAYFVLPRPTFRWLVDCAGLMQHLDSKYQRLVSDQRCIIYDLAFLPRRGASRRGGNRRRSLSWRTDV
jgi:hypothetical protein